MPYTSFQKGVIYEKGQRRDVSHSEIAQLKQWRSNMVQWRKDFRRYVRNETIFKDKGYR